MYLSEGELRHMSLNYNLFTLNELVLQILLINYCLTKLKESMITSLSLTDDFILDGIDQNIFYTFTKRYETKRIY